MLEGQNGTTCEHAQQTNIPSTGSAGSLGDSISGWPYPSVCPTCNRCPTCGNYKFPYYQPYTWPYPYTNPQPYMTISGVGNDKTDQGYV